MASTTLGEVWKLVRELTESQKETARKSQETDRQIQETSRQIAVRILNDERFQPRIW